MPSIKESMQDVYGDRKFTQQLQQQTLQKLQKSQRPKKQRAINVVLTLAIVFISFVVIMGNKSVDEDVLTSSTLAPTNADTVLLERYAQFQTIVQDGTITDQERRVYASVSDWDLQLAFESGTSIFYNRPPMTKKQIEAVNDLLHRMYYVIYDQKNIEGESFPTIDSFQSLLSATPELNEQLASIVKTSYQSSLTEKPFTNNAFLNEVWWLQLIIGGLFLLFVYLFIQNIRHDHKKLAGFFQILFIVVLGMLIFSKDDTLYSYNETSMMESAQKHIKEYEEHPYKVSDLLAITQFEGVRVAMFEVDNDQQLLMEYRKYNGRYKFQGSSISDLPFINSTGLNDNYETTTLVVFENGADISAVAQWDENHKKEYKIPLQHGSKIYQLIVPEEVTNSSIYLYDKEGNPI